MDINPDDIVGLEDIWSSPDHQVRSFHSHRSAVEGPRNPLRKDSVVAGAVGGRVEGHVVVVGVVQHHYVQLREGKVTWMRWWEDSLSSSFCEIF